MEFKIHSTEEVEKRAAQLPPEIQKMLYSPEMGKVIQQVGQKHQLHIDQMDLLSAETGQVMLGFVEPKDYPEILQDSLRVDRVTADAIAQDINELLFAQIRESMKKLADLPSAQEDIQPLSATTADIPTTIAPVSATPTAPKPEFPKADVMLTQKTVTPPAPVVVASPVHETHVVVPPKLGALTTPPPAMPTAPSTFVTTPAPAGQPVSHMPPPMTTLPPKIPLAAAPIPPAAPLPPPAPQTFAPAPAHLAPPPPAPATTPPAAPAATALTLPPAAPATPPPAQSAYKTDPYREPIE